MARSQHQTVPPQSALCVADPGAVFTSLAQCSPIPGGIILTAPDTVRLVAAVLERWPGIDHAMAMRQVRAYLAPCLVGGTERILYDGQREPLIAMLDWLARTARLGGS